MLQLQQIWTPFETLLRNKKPAPIVVTLATVAKTAPPTLVVSTARDLMIAHQKNVQPSSWKNVISIKITENIAFPEARTRAQQASHAQVASARPNTSANLRPSTSPHRPAPLLQPPPATTTATIACQTDDLPMLPPLDLSSFKKPASSTQTSLSVNPILKCQASASTDALWPHELAEPAPKAVSSIPRPRSTQNLAAKPSATDEKQPSKVVQPPSPAKRRTSDEPKAVKRKKHRSNNATTRK